MNKEFVSYEIALKLKELGFDEPCFGKYDGKGNNKGKIWFEMPNRGQDTIPVGDVLAPTFSQAFRWFREKYGLFSWITMELGNKTTFCWVLSGEHTRTQYAAYFHTYEETELACLKKLIEIVNPHKLPDLTWKDSSEEEIKSKQLKSMKGKRL